MKKRTYAESLTAVFVAVVFSTFVLYTGARGYQAIQMAKFSAFCWIFGGFLGLIILLFAELWIVGQRRPVASFVRWRSWSCAKKLVALYWLLTVISALASPFWPQTLLGMTREEGLLTVSIYCGCFFCVAEYVRPRPWMMHLICAVTTVFCVYCLLQMAGYDPLHLYPPGYGYQNANIDYAGIYLGTIGNADLTAALLCMAAAASGIWLLAGRSRARLWSVLPFGLCLWTLWRLQVQAGLLAMTAGAFVILPLILPCSTKKRKWLWLSSALLALAALTGIYLFAPDSGTLHELQQVLHGNWDPAFGNARIFIWREVLVRIPQHIWLGLGPDTMAAAGISYYSRVVDGVSIPVIVDTAHNEYLNILYHQGAPALAVYLGALGSSLGSWLKRGREDLESAICGGVLLCYGIQAFFSFSMCAVTGIFWVVWGILECRKTEGEK